MIKNLLNIDHEYILYLDGDEDYASSGFTTHENAVLDAERMKEKYLRNSKAKITIRYFYNEHYEYIE